MKKLFLVIGAPGSGKTTDAQLIAENNSSTFVHFSTGDLLRDEVASKSEKGKVIDELISAGNLVPIDIVIEVILEAIKRSDKPVVIIDGYPRSEEQMLTLDKHLKAQSEIELAGVFKVDVSEAVAKERVLGRARGADDNEQVFANRMKVFLDPLSAIERFYGNANLLHSINGERTIDEIVADLQKQINALL